MDEYRNSDRLQASIVLKALLFVQRPRSDQSPTLMHSSKHSPVKIAERWPPQPQPMLDGLAIYS